MRISGHTTKIWMCLTCTAAILAGAATVWAQMGGGMFGGGAASQFKGVWSPVVGDGAEYQMTSTRQPGPSEIGIAIVAKDDVNGQPGYWMEITTKSPRSGGDMYMKMLILTNGGVNQTEKMVMQMPPQPPMEMDMQMMQGMAARRPPQSADVTKQAQDVGSETVTVPAGTFTCEHYKTSEGDDVWITPKVSPWGLVKMSGHDGTTMTLDKVITDAKDMITGTPTQMQMPNMGGMGGPPQQ
jgi:hypothetical protein